VGKVMNKLRITNDTDAANALQGLIPLDRVRSTEIDALVDTGATLLALPEEVVAQVAVPVRGARRVKNALGVAHDVPWVGGLRLEILGREMTCDALVLPRGATPPIGQVVMETLDLHVDPKSRDLIVNPASPDMPLLDLMSVA
jgi:predicted aspartyl protease